MKAAVYQGKEQLIVQDIPYISMIYVPKVGERIKVLNGEGKASGIQLE